MLPNSNCKYRRCWVGCMALWWYKSMLCFASKQLPPQKKSLSHIPDPTPKKKAEVCSKTWEKAKVWRLAKKDVEQGINLNASWHVLTDGRRLDQLNSNLLGSPLKDCPSTLMSFCKFSNYTEWWWCVKVKTVHSMMSRNVPKVAHSMFQ